jgi:sulfonate dioxygenase
LLTDDFRATPGGGDTAFSSLTAAYSALSPVFAATLDGLELEHSSLSLARSAELGPAGSRAEGVVTTHPLVIRHPVCLSRDRQLPRKMGC